MSNTHIVYTHTYIIGIGTIERDVTHCKCKQGENKHSPPGMYYIYRVLCICMLYTMRWSFNLFTYNSRICWRKRRRVAAKNNKIFLIYSIYISLSTHIFARFKIRVSGPVTYSTIIRSAYIVHIDHRWPAILIASINMIERYANNEIKLINKSYRWILSNYAGK